MADRAAVRRGQLGMTEGELARRAGMSVAYLRRLWLLDGDFDPSAVRRVAEALGMTAEELTGGRPDAPEGQSVAAPHPALSQLPEGECWERLGTHGIGRLGLPTRAAPLVLPVNYLVDARTVVYRTEPESPAAVTAGAPLSFEADHFDDRSSGGWSVLLTGTADRISDPAAVRALAARPGARPWAGGPRNLWIRVVPVQVSGRYIRHL
ncbi:pyridoxamine 5'-phosphate oxidase family protein [Streptomyces pactum]|uniref:Pyridoxamine 5'-phosphate oxidase family protein n=1 Tax=Streptomyces pactum TaxID=68249 RepID=A0ABS0NFJ0_9ACTN|nr:pyridoxamine 5'-phosphate oxidase family protein [Streptomyces pactum]MBH5333954.1 pyridoxamine 5'-phosphate oxidase family protein [Streptomyces pactum]